VNGPGKEEQGLDSALRQAAQDFRYLLDRGYPREASLNLVGNRYGLDRKARQILHRGVFAPAVARERRAKLRKLSELTGVPLALDGHNVLITLECAFRGLPVVWADDGYFRDIAELSRAFRFSPESERALALLAAFLKAHQPGPVVVLYDAPLSKSGELARRTREVLATWGIAAEVRALPVPEKELLVFSGAVATSDTHLIDARQDLVDLAGEIILQEAGKGRAFRIIVLQDH
jgi:hypothetical protein